MTPAISVIIPIYNVEKYISGCLESVLHQTFSDIEIICVNDGSTDNSDKILAEYAAQNTCIKVLTQTNKGQSAARNLAISKARGKYIYFIDSDDKIHPQTLEILYNVAEKTSSPIVTFAETKKYCSDKINIDELSYRILTPALPNLLQNIASSSVIWNKLYETKLIKNKPFIEGIYFEDWPWVTCLFAEIPHYIEVPYALYNYNTQNTSTMRSQWTVRKLNDFATGIRAVKEYFSQPQKTANWPLVRRKRISASIKMMINKTYHASQSEISTYSALLEILSALRNEKCFCLSELPLKVILRLLKIYCRKK